MITYALKFCSTKFFAKTLWHVTTYGDLTVVSLHLLTPLAGWGSGWCTVQSFAAIVVAHRSLAIATQTI